MTYQPACLLVTGVGIQVALGEISGMLGLKGGGHGTLGKKMEDVREESRYKLRELFGEDAFYDSLDDVMKAYRQQTDEKTSELVCSLTEIA